MEIHDNLIRARENARLGAGSKLIIDIQNQKLNVSSRQGVDI
jgi:hypothetical protein